MVAERGPAAAKPPRYEEMQRYATRDYWDARYAARASTESTFDYYADLAIFKEPLINALPGMRSSCQILHVGSGNSRLPEQLFELGYVHQRVNDISPVVVDRMRARTIKTCPGIRWEAGDAADMPHIESDSIDAVIDKGTYDALGGSGGEHRLVKEAWRVLRSGGVYVLMSSQQRACRAFRLEPAGSGEGGCWARVCSTHTILRDEEGLQGECWLHVGTKP